MLMAEPTSLSERPMPAGAGKTYLLQGRTGLPAFTDLRSSPADLTALGGQGGEHSGFALAVGDVNADGVGDLVIGAADTDTRGGADAGAVYVIFGRGQASP